MVGLLGAVAGWLLFATLLTALGTLAARWVIVPRAGAHLPDGEHHLLAAAARLGSLAVAILPLAMSLLFARQLIEFRDPFAAWSEEARLLLTTQWGVTWTRAVATSLLALVGYGLVRAGIGFGWLLATAAVLALAAYPAFSGHASGTEGLRALTRTADVVHVASAGVWVGGLAFVLYAERTWRAQGLEPRTALPVLVPIFSPMAIMAVSLLIVTGTLASWVHLESLGALFGTAYGRLLSLKLVVVLAVLALGAVNWKRLSPRLDESAGQDALFRNAARELAVAQIVLIVTAVLVRTSPMGR